MYIPPPPSPEAKELGDHLTDLINAYQADHPHMSPMEVRQAVRLAQHAAPDRPCRPSDRQTLERLRA